MAHDGARCAVEADAIRRSAALKRGLRLGERVKVVAESSRCRSGDFAGMRAECVVLVTSCDGGWRESKATIEVWQGCWRTEGCEGDLKI